MDTGRSTVYEWSGRAAIGKGWYFYLRSNWADSHRQLDDRPQSVNRRLSLYHNDMSFVFSAEVTALSSRTRPMGGYSSTKPPLRITTATACGTDTKVAINCS